MMNVEFFISKVSDYEVEMREKVVSFVKGFGHRIIEEFFNLLTKIDIGKSTLVGCGFSVEEVENRLKMQYDSLAMNAMLKSRKEILRDFYNKSKNKIRSKGLKFQDWDEHVITSEIGQIFSLDMMLALTMQLFLDRIKDKNSRISLSDGADLMHSSYIPHCDIFRADKRTVDLANKLSRKISMADTVILKNPEELPQAIKNIVYKKNISASVINNLD
jgi:hypothetical protein